jgi:hypothetical protein
MFANPKKGNYSDIQPFAKCPSCNQLIKMKSFTDAVMEGARECPFCHFFIEKRQIIASCESYLKTTKAIQYAHHIESMQKGLLIVAGLVFIAASTYYFGGLEKYNFLFFLYLFIVVMILLGGLLNIQNWLAEFGKIQTADEEFFDARKKVRQAQIIWVWANIVNAIWWIIYIKFL